MDKLDEMFAMQEHFLKSARPLMPRILPKEDPMTWNSEYAAEFFKEHKEQSLAVMMEAAELMDWTPWKHWSKQVGNKMIAASEVLSPVHRDEVAAEIVDTIKFLLNVSILWGITPVELVDHFRKKDDINHKRLNSGVY